MVFASLPDTAERRKPPLTAPRDRGPLAGFVPPQAPRFSAASEPTSAGLAVTHGRCDCELPESRSSSRVCALTRRLLTSNYMFLSRTFRGKALEEPQSVVLS